MTVAAAHEAISLELPGGSVPVLLFAGGTTGLVLLAGTEPARAFCASLGEAAEASGLSALAFADAIPGDAALAADRAASAAREPRRRADGARGARRRRGRRHFAPRRARHSRPSSSSSRASRTTSSRRCSPTCRSPKLVLVRGDDAEAQATAAAAYRHAIGPIVVQHLPGGDWMAGETAAMIAEATITFAIGVCGDGRRA